MNNDKYDKSKKDFDELLDELINKSVFLTETVDEYLKPSLNINWKRKNEIKHILSNYTYFTLINNNSKNTALRKKFNEKHPETKQTFKEKTNLELLKFVHIMENDLNYLLIKYINFIEISIKNKLSKILERNGGKTAIYLGARHNYPYQTDYLDDRHFNIASDKDDQKIRNLRETLRKIEEKYFNSTREDRTHFATPYEFLIHADLSKVFDIINLLKRDDLEELASEIIIYRSTEKNRLNKKPLVGEKLNSLFSRYFEQIYNYRNKIVHRNKMLGYKTSPPTRHKDLVQVFNNHIGEKTTLIPQRDDVGKSDLYAFFLTIFIFIHDEYILERFIEDIENFIKKYDEISKWTNTIDLYTYYSIPHDTIKRLRSLKSTLPVIKAVDTPQGIYTSELEKLDRVLSSSIDPSETAETFSEFSPQVIFYLLYILKKKGIDISKLTLEDVKKLYFIVSDLNNIFLKYILYVEKMLKSRINDLILEKYQSVDILDRTKVPPEKMDDYQNNYKDPENYEYFYHDNYPYITQRKYNHLINSIDKSAYKDSLLSYYIDGKNHIPPWILFNELPLGTILFYLNLLAREDHSSLINSMVPYFFHNDPGKLNEYFSHSFNILKDYRNIFSHEFQFINGFESKYISKFLIKNTIDFSSDFTAQDYNRYLNNIYELRGYSALSLIIMSYIQDREVAEAFMEDLKSFLNKNDSFFEQSFNTNAISFLGLFDGITELLSKWTKIK